MLSVSEKSQDSILSDNQRNILLAEYAAAQDDYMHNDSFPWQVGSVLIAGAFVFWGLILDRHLSPVTLGVSALLVTLLMSIWLLFSNHYRQAFLCKIHRLHEIEQLLGMQSHSRWRPVTSNSTQSGYYRTYGPSGHFLNASIYFLTSTGTSIIGLLMIGWNWWLIIPLPFTILTLLWTGQNERRLKHHLKKQDIKRVQ
jgi:hypothetical protein